MKLDQSKGIGGLLKQGHTTQEGVDEAVSKNIEAAKQLGRIVHSSMGPNGMVRRRAVDPRGARASPRRRRALVRASLSRARARGARGDRPSQPLSSLSRLRARRARAPQNKLVINHLEKTIVTSDCATIVRELEVAHPAARMITLAAEMQEQEAGDGTNLVIAFASELLKHSEDLLRQGLHPSEIVEGFKAAQAKCLELLPSCVCHEVRDLRDVKQLAEIVTPVVCAKQPGYEGVLAPIIAEACTMVMPPASSGKKPSVNSDSVRIAKLPGSSIGMSRVMQGMVVLRDTETTIKSLANAKVCAFGCGLEQSQTESKGTVLLRNADELLNYNNTEEAHLEGVIKSIADSGVGLAIVGGSISEMALHFLEKHKVAALKIQSKWELRRLCMSTGATAMVRLGAPTPEEMGSLATLDVQEVGGRKITVLTQGAGDDSRIATIVLRASTNSMLSDLERACDDGINTVKALCKDARCVAGGGATEIELAHQIQTFGKASSGLDQYAIGKFGEALECVPRVLAENSGRDAIKVLSALYDAHKKGEKGAGVHVDDGSVVDQAAAGVHDSLFVKESAINLAADAAITVLRVDLIIMAKAAGGPKAPPQGGPDA